MTEEDLHRVEFHLGPLPAEFRRFLLTATRDDQRDLGCGTYDVGKLIKENARVRLNGEDYRVRQPDGGDAPWPADWVVLSDNGGGDYWFVRGEDEGRSLWFWNHASCEAYEDAPTIGDSVEACRERRREYERLHPPKAKRVDTIDHPALGLVEIQGSAFYRKGRPAIFLWPEELSSDTDPDIVRTTLDRLAPLVLSALAGEQQVFDLALPQLVELQHQPMWWLRNAPKLTPEQIRERLVNSMVDIRCAPREEGGEVEVEFAYDGGEAFGWEPLVVRCDPNLTVREVERRVYF